MSRLPRRVAGVVTTYSKTTIVVMLLATAVMAAGVPMVEQASDPGQFETESDAADAQTYIGENFASAQSENQTSIQLIQRAGEDGNALSQDALIASLELQQTILADESISATLVDERPITGVANAIAGDAIEQRSDLTESTLENQLTALRDLEQADLEALIESVLGEDGNQQALALMPTGYEQGSTTADSHVTFIRQQTLGGSINSPNGFSEEITSSQLELRDLANQQDGNFAVFGTGIITDEVDRSLGDSIAIVGPLALLFVVVALTVAYRDLIDILLGVVGILAVLLWTFGFMGWTGVNFNQILISVPVLLIGLSIDYAIHVFMRYREQRNSSATEAISRSMTVALGGVGVALVWVTATAAIGFLANLTSPIGPLRDFGIVSAVGVLAALLIYGSLIPALKVELDGLLEGFGFDRRKPAFGTSGGLFSRILSVGATAARRFPVAVVVLTLLITAGGVAGATQVDTSFSQEDFLADSPPSWTQSLPGPLAPGEYQAKDDLQFVQANFQQEGNEGEFLIRPGDGDVVTAETLARLDRATDEIDRMDTAFTLPGGQTDLTTPLSLMQATAAGAPDSQFAQSFAAAAGTETTDPAELQTLVPEENVAGLFDELLAASPQAAEYVYREDGSYEALRIQVGLDAAAETGTVADELRSVAVAIEGQTDDDWSVVATGDQVVNDVVQQDLLDTVIQGLAITLVLVFVFLAGAYRLTGSPASLGIVTLLPVLFAVTWILGSMWLLGIPFNSLTGTITSLTIGLGIAYSIHISSRYELELRRQGNVWEAMETTVTGTGGALLGSAATTVGGFGTLSFAIFPVLQQFGIITGLTIIYAFLASVFVLPSLLVVWTRYLGPSAYFPASESDEPDQSGETAAGGR